MARTRQTYFGRRPPTPRFRVAQHASRIWIKGLGRAHLALLVTSGRHAP